VAPIYYEPIMSRYGPQKTCQVCQKFTATPVSNQEDKAICSISCFEKYTRGLQYCIKNQYQQLETFDKSLKETTSKLEAQVKETNRTRWKLEGLEETVKQWSSMLDKAGVPTGGTAVNDFTLRLEFLIEEHYCYRKFVPVTALVLMDDE
jgi:hypothetical protein